MKLCRQTRVLLIVAFTAISASFPALAWTASRAPWAGVVTYVVDGDTLQVRPPEGGKPVSIRIDGIDAPEICQPGGTTSRNALMRKLLGKRVLVYSKVHDGYDRLVARIVFNGEDQGRWMVAHGLAWSYRYRNYAGPYAVQQRQAEHAGLGLFSPALTPAPAYPGKFRKEHGSCYFQLS